MKNYTAVQHTKKIIRGKKTLSNSEKKVFIPLSRSSALRNILTMTPPAGGSHHPRRNGPRPRGSRVGASTLECGATASPPRRLGDHICPGSPLGHGAWCPRGSTLARPGLRFCGGTGAGCGWLRRKHIGFCSVTDPCGRHLAGRGLPALCLAWPWFVAGPGWSLPLAHSYLQALQRERRTAWGPRTSSPSSPAAPAPLARADRHRGVLAGRLSPWIVCGTLHQMSPLISLEKYLNLSCLEMVLLQRKASSYLQERSGGQAA